MASKKSENIYLIAGEDAKIIKEEVKKIENKFKEKYKNLDSISYFAEETDTNEIIDNCNTFSVFSNFMLIKVYDFDKSKLDLIAKYVENPNPSTVLVLISFKNTKDLGNSKDIKTIKSKSKVVDIKPLYDNQIIEKIHKNLKALKLNYTIDVVDYIAQQVGKVDSGISNFFELIKVANIQNKITIEDVKELETISTEKNLFSFLDYFFSKNIISAINSYKSLISEGTPLLVLNRSIYNRTKQYIKYLSLKEQNKPETEIMSELKIYNRWYYNKTKNEAMKLGNINILRFILKKCYEIDKSIKSEPEEVMSTRFELFLTDLKKDWLNF
ncbi:MAG: DNA polymerase III subunit delta [bacterium]